MWGEEKKKKTRLNKKENKKSVCSTIKFNVNYYAQRLLRELIQYLRVNFFFFSSSRMIQRIFFLFRPSLLVITSDNNFCEA